MTNVELRLLTDICGTLAVNLLSQQKINPAKLLKVFQSIIIHIIHK